MRPKNAYNVSSLQSWNHVYNPQMGIQSLFHILKWRILLFLTHNPFIRGWSNLVLECDPKLRKMRPKNYTSLARNQNHVSTTPQMGIQSIISYLETENIYFSTHNHLYFRVYQNSGLEWWPEVDRKCSPRTDTSSTQQLKNPLCTTLKWVSKSWFHIWKGRILLFPTHNPSLRGCSNSGLECDPKLRKMWPKNYTSLARNQDLFCNPQMGIQIWFYICKWRILLFNP